jgi:hypothetical protein
MNVVARAVDDVNQFVESLEKTGAFAGLLSREEHVNEEGRQERRSIDCACRRRMTGTPLPTGPYQPSRRQPLRNPNPSPERLYRHRDRPPKPRSSPMTLLRRIVQEKKGVLLPLAVVWSSTRLPMWRSSGRWLRSAGGGPRRSRVDGSACGGAAARGARDLVQERRARRGIERVLSESAARRPHRLGA